ncbi:MAG: P83/100 family protein [Treponema sp.]
MKKCTIFLTFILLTIPSLFAIDVDEKEIRDGGNTTIDFINYNGRHDEIDSVEAIRRIGADLSGASTYGQAGASNRYLIIHAVDASIKEGLDADIIILGSQVNVDHIDNLRLIIEGYLSSSYGYSRQDAKTLAHFITIYNAVYRGNMQAFSKKYKNVVLKNLSSDKVGLATNYTEWPGKTQIVIPLTDQKYSGTISTVDTGVISDKAVVDKMKEQDDKDIEARKDMVDLKEKESDEARRRAEEARKQALEKEKEAKDAQQKANDANKNLKDKEKQLQDKEKAAQKAQKDAEDAKKNNASDKDDKQKKADQANKEAENAKAERDRAKEEKDRQEAEAKNKQDEVDSLTEDATNEEKMAEDKMEDAQSDRKDIAADTQKIIEDKKAEKKAETDALIASAVRAYALKVVDQETLSSSIVMLDLRNARQIKTSSLDTIRGRHVYEVGENLLAIAGSSSGNGIVSLVLINARSLEVVKQSSDVIAEESMLAQDGDYYYAIVSSSGKYYLGKFNAELERQSLSPIAVMPYSPISITEQGILVQDESSSIHLLDKTNLKDTAAGEKKNFTSFKNETN